MSSYMNSTTLKSYELNKLHKLKQKVRLIFDDICFLKSCKKNKVFPKFIQVNIPIKNSVTKKVIHNAKINWLNLEIKSLYAKKANFEIQALELHLLITKNLNTIEFSYFQIHYNSIIQSIEFKSKHKVQKLNQKLENLKLNTHIERPNNITNQALPNQVLVQNCSSFSFNKEEINLLNKGLKYNIKLQNEI